MQNYWVVVRAYGDTSQATRGTGRGTVSESLSVSIELLDEVEAGQLRDESGVAGVAPSMPMSLFEPLDANVLSKSEDVDWPFIATGVSQSDWTGRGTTVAVLDTGIDESNSAFRGIDLRTRNFSDDSDGTDLRGHGTHCAGTLFGQDIQGQRIGVARGVEKALIGKVVGSEGASTTTLIRGILWAVDEGADIISMSLGLNFSRYAEELRLSGFEEQAALSSALDAYVANVELFRTLTAFVSARERGRGGVLFCAASGNSSDRTMGRTAVVRSSTPASTSEIISVGAITQSAEGAALAPFSNSNVDFVAPGVGILSAWPAEAPRLLSGTSMATPHVAGVAALWLEHLRDRSDYDVTASQVRACLTASGEQKQIVGDLDKSDVGFGIPQAP